MKQRKIDDPEATKQAVIALLQMLVDRGFGPAEALVVVAKALPTVLPAMCWQSGRSKQRMMELGRLYLEIASAEFELVAPQVYDQLVAKAERLREPPQHPFNQAHADFIDNMLHGKPIE